MEKKHILIAFAAILLVIGSVFIVRVVRERSNDYLFERMVDALSISEGDAGSGKCWNSITTSDGELVLYCGTCTWIPGHHTWNSGNGKCD